MSLKGKTAIVTGGARGIGLSIAKRLARDGANIAVLDILDGTTAVKELEALGVKAMSVKADVTSPESVEAAVKTVQESFDTLDILINNAGITRDNLLLRMKKEDWDMVLNINLTGMFNMVKGVVRPMMKQKAGKIVNIASVVGQIGNPGQANYSAAKAGAIGLTKTLAREFAGKNIQVNAVAPGFIDTEMTQSLPENVVEYFIKNIPAGTFGKPEDVANGVAFLVSSDADYVTGQVLNVDGGMVM